MGYKSPSADQSLRDFESKFPDALALEGNWVGIEKIRYDFVLKYLSGHSTSRGYYVHSFKDRNDNRFLSFLDCETITIPFSKEDILDDNKYTDDHKISAGDCFSCKATVNRHGVNTYKSSVQNPFKETVLNRVKFKHWLGRTSVPRGPNT